MILTCPECATSYFVDDARVPAAGRKVKCASCGARWMATPEDADGHPQVPAEDEALQPAEAAAYDAFPEDPEPIDAEVVDVEPEPVAAKARSRLSRPSARASTGGSGAVIWAAVAGLAAVLIAGIIVFRQEVVKLAPVTSTAFASLGLSVDGGGLVLEEVRAEPTFVAGRPVLSITGAIRNVRNEAVSAPPLRVTLLDRAGQPVAATIARPHDATLPAHARRRFTVAISDPPATAHDLEVRFLFGREAKAPAHGAEAALSTSEAAHG